MFINVFCLQLKERTFQQIEEVNKRFTAVHDTLLIKAKSPGATDSKVRNTQRQSCNKVKLIKKRKLFCKLSLSKLWSKKNFEELNGSQPVRNHEILAAQHLSLFEKSLFFLLSNGKS